MAILDVVELFHLTVYLRHFKHILQFYCRVGLIAITGWPATYKARIISHKIGSVKTSTTSQNNGDPYPIM